MASIDTIADRSTGSAVAGKAYFETSTNKFIVYNGSSWVEIDSDGTGPVYFNKYAALFDGTNDFFTLSSAATLYSSTGYTMSAWVNSTEQDAGYNHILKASANDYISIVTDVIRINGTAGYIDIPNTTANSDDLQGWHHHVVTYDGSVAKYYLDGVYEGAATKNIGNIAVATLSVSSTYEFGGYMSDVAIFNSALTDGSVSVGDAVGGEIASLRDSGKPVDISTLGLNIEAWWRFGDDSNDSPVDGAAISSVTDSSGNGYTLSASGIAAPYYYELPSDNEQRV